MNERADEPVDRRGGVLVHAQNSMIWDVRRVKCRECTTANSALKYDDGAEAVQVSYLDATEVSRVVQYARVGITRLSHPLRKSSAFRGMLRIGQATKPGRREVHEQKQRGSGKSLMTEARLRCQRVNKQETYLSEVSVGRQERASRATNGYGACAYCNCSAGREGRLIRGD